MGTAAALLATHHHTTGDGVVLPDVVCTLLYVVAIIATIIAFVGLVMSLVGGGGRVDRTGVGGIFVNWMYAAAVALVAWLLWYFLC